MAKNKWKQILPVIGICCAYGAYVLKDRYVQFVHELEGCPFVTSICLASRRHHDRFEHHEVIKEELKEDRRRKRIEAAAAAAAEIGGPARSLRREGRE